MISSSNLNNLSKRYVNSKKWLNFVCTTHVYLVTWYIQKRNYNFPVICYTYRILIHNTVFLYSYLTRPPHPLLKGKGHYFDVLRMETLNLSCLTYVLMNIHTYIWYSIYCECVLVPLNPSNRFNSFLLFEMLVFVSNWMKLFGFNFRK